MMTEKKWRRFFKKEMDKEMAEIEGILEEMNSNPETKDIVAPEELHDKLFAQIRKEEAEKNRLSEEEKELIRLGTVYKKRRKWNKVVVLVAAVIGVMAIGITSFGGPEHVWKKLTRSIGDREQNYMNSDDERTDEIDVINEAEAYQQIEDEFGFYPVELVYMSEGIEFASIDIADSTQNIYLSYEGKSQESIVYVMYVNYRAGSIGRDAEDTLLEEQEKVVGNISLSVKKYEIEENQMIRYIADFEYQDVHYVLQFSNIDEVEVEKILDNLYFR